MSRDNQNEYYELERLLRVRRIDIEKQGCDLYSLLHKTETEEQSLARYLIDCGYCKASDLAEKIFAEIDTFAITKVICNGEVKYDITNKYRALKEKYSCPSPDEKCLRVSLESRIEKIKKYGGKK